jgi:hypothetical protein
VAHVVGVGWFTGFDMRPRILAILVAAVGIGLSQIASAADWPTKPVRIISPTSPGGVSDTFARMLAEGFADLFGQRFYVENRVGAGGLIGVAAAASAEPDGSTLVISGIAYTVIAPAASPNPVSIRCAISLTSPISGGRPSSLSSILRLACAHSPILPNTRDAPAP